MNKAFSGLAAGIVALSLSAGGASALTGRMFASSADASLVYGWSWDFNAAAGISEDDRTRQIFTTYATATPVSAVPIPAGGLLLLTGLAAAAGLGSRKRARA
jgi:hypothetical protein